jgi:hypothetical protein
MIRASLRTTNWVVRLTNCVRDPLMLHLLLNRSGLCKMQK